MLSDSPAADAGLRVGDLILQVGDVKRSPEAMSKLPALIQEKEDKSVEVVVLREGEHETRTLSLTPRSGPGHQGLLGCQVVPYHV